MESGALSVEDMTKALEGNDDAIMATAEDTRSFAESWAILKNSVAVALEPLASGIFKGIGDTIAEVTKYAKELGSEIRENLAQMFPNLADSGISLSDVLSNTLIPILKGIITVFAVVGTAVATVVGYVITGVQNMVAWFQSLPEKIANIPARMQEIGRSIVEGIKQGIREKVDTIFESLKSAISNGIQWIKNLLGIASPSKVFADIGRNTILGFEQGIDSATPDAIKAMEDATANISAAGAVNLAVSGGAGVRGGNVVYINGATVNDTPGIQNALVDFLLDLQRLGVMEGATA